MGWAFGAYVRGSAYDNQPWEILKWNRDIMGYRLIPLDSHIFTGDKIIMGLKMDTSKIPRDGLKYTSE
jgi:hypothetical protein